MKRVTGQPSVTAILITPESPNSETRTTEPNPNSQLPNNRGDRAFRHFSSLRFWSLGVDSGRRGPVELVAAIQNEYSLWFRDIETNGILAACEELGIGLVPYSPLGRGFLTGAVNESTTFAANDIRANSPRFNPEAIKNNRSLIGVMEKIGQQKGATPAQLALAWLLAQKPWVVPIPGSRKVERLDENLGATSVRFMPADLSEIATASSTVTAVGTRY